MKRIISLIFILIFMTNCFAEDTVKSPNKSESNLKYLPLGVPVVFGLYGAIFWDWGKVHAFRWRDEGWFQKDTYSGGADKLSHAYFHFLFSRMSYSFYASRGLTHEESLKQSFLLSTSIGLMIEVGDSFSHYGFSFNDLISNMAGIGFAHLLNSNNYLDELIGFQFWFLNDNAETKKRQNFYNQISDYNNQKYLLNLRFAALPVLGEFKPTRYINLDLGYYTRGYQVPEATNRRIPYIGASINFSQLLKDFFPNSDYAYYTSSVLKYYQAPYTGVELLK